LSDQVPHRGATTAGRVLRPGQSNCLRVQSDPWTASGILHSKARELPGSKESD
jgi:hypothetical protein